MTAYRVHIHGDGDSISDIIHAEDLELAIILAVGKYYYLIQKCRAFKIYEIR